MKKALSVLCAGALGLALLVLVPACHTMEGAGKDVERAGEKVQDAAS